MWRCSTLFTKDIGVVSAEQANAAGHRQAEHIPDDPETRNRQGKRQHYPYRVIPERHPLCQNSRKNDDAQEHPRGPQQ